MESCPLLEENPWSLDTDIRWIEEEEAWANYNNLQESNKNPDWFLQIELEPCPYISTMVLPYIELDEIFDKENSPLETAISHPWKEFPVLNLTKYEFLELLTWDGIKGNLKNLYLNGIFNMEENLRKSLFCRTWKFQDWFKSQDFEIKKEKISKISGEYTIRNSTWDFQWEETLIPAISILKDGVTKFNTEEWNSFCQEY
ncbi:hypothetical protein O181_086161 [Austropuccinia psidii MF-1]|uniref:Uncharacterized protein n=1 Tax=Austropuccinia psidii MF-1 TaxID=1389203 RepID=A0A9Q3IKD9_9BASI|nr:hypothetical protein [Austropuccinia psidii MF-1]